MVASAMPYGSASWVNQERYGSQGAAQVAALPDGGYVVVWVNYDAQGPGFSPAAGNAASDIRMRLFNADGSARGGEIAVNNLDRGWQVGPDVAVTPDGRIAVSWTDGWGFWGGAEHPGSLGLGDANGQSVMARFFSPAGQALGTQVLLNQTTVNNQIGVSVAALENGRFLFAWEDWSLSCDSFGCGGGPGIKARLYGSDGQALGSEQAWTGNWRFAPQPEALAGGGAAHIWLDAYYMNSALLVVRMHDPAGGALGSEVAQAIGGGGAGAQWSADGLADGGLVLAWTHRSPATGDGDGSGIRARLVNANGTPRGEAFVVNGTTASDQSQVRVAALDGGGFVAVWQHMIPADATRPSWTLQLRAQVFDAQGRGVGTELRVSAEDQALSLSDLIALDGGGFVVAWTGYSWVDTHVRAFGANGQPLGDTVVVHDAGGHQSQARLAALDDGRFSVTWLAAYDGYNGGDGSIEGIQTRSFATRGLTVSGGTSADTLLGTPLADTIVAGAGNDTVMAWDGSDSIDGGAGDDWLNGGAGNDTLVGGDGLDTAVYDFSVASAPVNFDGRAAAAMSASALGVEALATASAVATIGDGLGGTDRLDSIERLSVTGSPGSDTLVGGAGHDIVRGEAGNDTVRGADGNDTLDGGTGNDLVDGGVGNDQLSGGEGDDTLAGGGGNDTLDGGAGNDTAAFDGPRSGYAVTWQPTSSTYTLSSTGSGAVLVSGVERFAFANVTLAASALIDTVAPTTATFQPVSGATGVARTATIAVTFSEAIERGPGAITLTTAAGSVVEAYSTASDARVTLSGSTLTVRPGVALAVQTTYRLEFAAGSVRDLAGNAFAGTTDYSFTTILANPITGTAGNDTLTGSAGPDRISGLAGNDLLNGGADNDTLDGGAGSRDIVDYRGSAAVNANLATGVATRGSETDTLVGIEAIFGSSAGDTLRGLDGPANLPGETLRGGAGNDMIDGGSGIDMAEFASNRSSYTITRAPGTMNITVARNGGGGDGTDSLSNVELLLFSDRVIGFGPRVEEVARVAFALWTPPIVSSPTLFAKGLSFYTNEYGYTLDTLCQVALQWYPESGAQTAARLKASIPAIGYTTQQLIDIMAANGGVDSTEGRAAAVKAVALDPATTAQLELTGVLANGVVATYGFPSDPPEVYFGPLPG